MEELETLAAIYPELDYDPATLSGSLEIGVSFDEPISVVFGDTDTQQLKNLPPVLLFFALAEGYPEEKPPQIDLQCAWMTQKQKDTLHDSLMQLWGTLKDDSTMFACVDLIKEHVETLEQPVRVHERHKTQLLNHDTYADKAHFETVSFVCSICQETRKGGVCTQLACSHVSCTECLAEYYSTCITQGYIEMVHCVEVDCKEALQQEQLLELVGSDSFERYQKLVVKKRLERDPNSVECPRTNCDTLVFRKAGEYMGRCSRCKYTFCVNCRKAWHGTYRGCVVDTPPDKLLRHYMEDAEDEEKKDIEYKWGKANIEMHVKRLEREEEDDKLFQKAMEEAHIISCPHCKVPIEKSDGCNKIKCVVCFASFCFLCGVSLDPRDPYAHYKDKVDNGDGGPCAGKLFEGITEEELERRAQLAMLGQAEDDDNWDAYQIGG